MVVVGGLGVVVWIEEEEGTGRHTQRHTDE